MPSLQFEAILHILRAHPTPEDLSIAAQREATAVMAAQTPLPADVHHEEIQADSVPGLLLAAPHTDERRLLLFFHGGGYATGSSLTHRDLGWRLSAVSGARVLLPDYRLAPEHPFPAAVADALTVYRWALGQGIDPARIAVGGDSAGGGLALALLLSLRDGGEPLPATAVCLSPWVDLTNSGAAMRANAAADPMLRPNQLDTFAHLYLAGAPPDTPLASPLFADLVGLPPLFIQVGGAEILLDNGRRLAEKAAAAGVDVTLDVWPEMIHGWQGFAGVLPEGQKALTRVGAFVRRHLTR